MENPPFEDAFPIENGDFPISCRFHGCIALAGKTAGPWSFKTGGPKLPTSLATFGTSRCTESLGQDADGRPFEVSWQSSRVEGEPKGILETVGTKRKFYIMVRYNTHIMMKIKRKCI